MAGKTKLDKWTDTLDALNTERAELVYRLMEEDGADPGDWGAIARIQAMPHPELDDVNIRIQEHLAGRPQED